VGEGLGGDLALLLHAVHVDAETELLSPVGC
jgi:hypothetical protein